MMDPEKLVLVLIDVQPRLLQVMGHAERLKDKLSRLLRGAAVLNLPVLVTEQIPSKLGPTEPALRALLREDAVIVAKDTFSAMGEPAFVERLGAYKRREVLLAGIEAHVCVFQTASDLLAANYRVRIVADAVSSRDDEDRHIALEEMRAMGAEWTTVEMALFGCLKRATGDTFKEIHRIIK